jgi:hypothetical protein
MHTSLLRVEVASFNRKLFSILPPLWRTQEVGALSECLVRPVVKGGPACSRNRASAVTSWCSDRVTCGNGYTHNKNKNNNNLFAESVLNSDVPAKFSAVYMYVVKDSRLHLHFERMSSGFLLRIPKIQSISVQTQHNSIYYIELHVSTYLRSSSGSQLVLCLKDQLVFCFKDQLWTWGWPEIGRNM